MIKYPLVYIEWEDSVLGFQGWKLIDEQPDGLTTFISVGFKVKEDKRSITIYPHIEKCNEDHAGAGDIKIPKSAIRKIKTLKC
jgi:hypothetical protein